ncbi:hypothetical protein CDD80_1749 [Ophiocordyceps camponoti-rufipedis]|uniref:D-arabinono-1,4-lactone oxidase n=1 Tax=Ophiocordyceps camponoti-rufipedis TaxID=2004952 RepID=A0A2C5Z2V0_9HYPO|nr:hypothetical protein CDD80_1749 [Ophiocordyceps camponoti-rufipedis]
MNPLATSLEKATGDEDDGIPFRARRNHVHRTWAGTFTSLPELYIQPQTIAEVEKAVRLAQQRGRRIVTTGSGHSPSSLTCTSSWMLNLDHLSRIVSLDSQTGIVVVEAGIRLGALTETLSRHGLALPNLGSIDQQSIAGALATGTHGSSLRHGLVSEAVTGLRITLAGGRTERCDARVRPELFRAALLSLGALGVVVEVTIQAVPAFDIAWRQRMDAEARMLESWREGTLWTQAEFVRVWWFPYTRRAVVWRGDKTERAVTMDEEQRGRGDGAKGWLDGVWPRISFNLHRGLLWLAHWVPSVLPTVEWLVFGLEYGFADGTETGAVEPGRRALLMDCLYSQFVNEWALPLHRGPEALARLGAWLHGLPAEHPDHYGRPIPFPVAGLYVHAPIEVRVCDTTKSKPRPLLDPTADNTPTLFLNATLYRPFGLNPPCHHRYYQAFEWLMSDLDGRPHWAKNFLAGRAEGRG